MSKLKPEWQAEAQELGLPIAKEDGTELTIEELQASISEATEKAEKEAAEKAASDKAGAEKKEAEAKAAAEKAARGGVSEKDQEKQAKKMLADKAKANDKVYKLNKEQAKAQAKKREEEAKAVQATQKGKKVKLRALCGLSGKYHLPYSEGQEFSINEKQAKEILDNRDAEKV